MSRAVAIGNVVIGGGQRTVRVQSMLSVGSKDMYGNVQQAKRLEQAGCEILRLAIPDANAVRLIPALKDAVSMPLVADIHFDYRLALASIQAGVDKVRINPGNIGGDENVRSVVGACAQKGIPIRIGVNSGSLEKDVLARHGGVCARAMVDSARRHVQLANRFDFDNLVLSLKSSDVRMMIEAYRLAAEEFDYPLHIGVTEAGIGQEAVIRSSIGIGSLLCDSIGDTVRVSLTGDPVREVEAAYQILDAIGLRRRGVQIISCPTCGRCEIDMVTLTQRIKNMTAHIQQPIRVAVMGCTVNGPGEAREADIGIAGGRESAMLFKAGKPVRRLTGDIAAQLLREIEILLETGEQT